MQDYFVNHSIHCEDDASWNYNHKNESEHLIAFGDDVMVKASGYRKVFMPNKRKESDDSAKYPTEENFERDVFAIFRISQWKDNRLGRSQ